jgi:hypothetical protein
MNFPCTPSQFAALETAIRADSAVRLELATPTSGMLTTNDVSLDFSYDGAALLTASVTAKHSLAAKLAPESVIEERIAQSFAQWIEDGGTA